MRAILGGCVDVAQHSGRIEREVGDRGGREVPGERGFGFGQAFARFLLNSTIGIAGIFDPAWLLEIEAVAA